MFEVEITKHIWFVFNKQSSPRTNMPSCAVKAVWVKWGAAGENNPLKIATKEMHSLVMAYSKSGQGFRFSIHAIEKFQILCLRTRKVLEWLQVCENGPGYLLLAYGNVMFFPLLSLNSWSCIIPMSYHKLSVLFIFEISNKKYNKAFWWCFYVPNFN